MHVAQAQVATHPSYQQRTEGNNTAILMHVFPFSFFCNECAINTAVTSTFVVVA